MQLINTRTLKLKEFMGDPPAYAILSHTWEEEEVTFQDIHGPNATSKKGFAKIRDCCAQALTDGLEWAWVDTCCIDKSSSTTLSEAINSMYRWYAESAVCYAYLSDVHVNNPEISGQSPEDHVVRAFRDILSDVEINKDCTLLRRQDKANALTWGRESHLTPETTFQKMFCGSRWFTRGWTLQELIAPPRLEFFNSHWAPLGSKILLQSHITFVTQIEAPYLTEYESNNVNAGLVFSWAAERKTTREEDIAYCLLGLFDISMPLLYGEGPKAFVRLQQEIMRQADDYTLLMWGFPDRNHYNFETPNDHYRYDFEIPNDYFRSSAVASSPASFSHGRKFLQCNSISSPANSRDGRVPLGQIAFGARLVDISWSEVHRKVPDQNGPSAPLEWTNSGVRIRTKAYHSILGDSPSGPLHYRLDQITLRLSYLNSWWEAEGHKYHIYIVIDVPSGDRIGGPICIRAIEEYNPTERFQMYLRIPRFGHRTKELPRQMHIALWTPKAFERTHKVELWTYSPYAIPTITKPEQHRDARPDSPRGIQSPIHHDIDIRASPLDKNSSSMGIWIHFTRPAGDCSLGHYVLRVSSETKEAFFCLNLKHRYRQHGTTCTFGGILPVHFDAGRGDPYSTRFRLSETESLSVQVKPPRSKDTVVIEAVVVPRGQTVEQWGESVSYNPGNGNRALIIPKLDADWGQESSRLELPYQCSPDTRQEILEKDQAWSRMGFASKHCLPFQDVRPFSRHLSPSTTQTEVRGRENPPELRIQALGMHLGRKLGRPDLGGPEWPALMQLAWEPLTWKDIVMFEEERSSRKSPKDPTSESSEIYALVIWFTERHFERFGPRQIYGHTQYLVELLSFREVMILANANTSAESGHIDWEGLARSVKAMNLPSTASFGREVGRTIKNIDHINPYRFFDDGDDESDLDVLDYPNDPDLPDASNKARSYVVWEAVWCYLAEVVCFDKVSWFEPSDHCAVEQKWENFVAEEDQREEEDTPLKANMKDLRSWSTADFRFKHGMMQARWRRAAEAKENQRKEGEVMALDAKWETLKPRAVQRASSWDGNGASQQSEYIMDEDSGIYGVDYC